MWLWITEVPIVRIISNLNSKTIKQYYSMLQIYKTKIVKLIDHNIICKQNFIDSLLQWVNVRKWSEFYIGPSEMKLEIIRTECNWSCYADYKQIQ